MRNLKKFLALVLAMMMVMSLMVTVNAASTSNYSDANEITPVYAEAIEVLSALKVLEGDASGFRPGDTITRAEAAKILYCITTGDVTKNSKFPEYFRDNCEFTDVLGTADDWAAGFIGYAAANGLVVGDGNGKFRPGDPVTGYEMQTMLLRAVGYGKKGEFLGDGYKTESTRLATSLGLLANIPAGILGMKATREMAAEMTFRTVADVPQVIYSDLLGVYNPTNGLVTLGTPNPTLGDQHFDLKLIEGELIAVDREKGTIKIAPYVDADGSEDVDGNTAGKTGIDKRKAYTVHDVDAITWADIENIGYKVCVWGVKGVTTDVRNYNAITDYEVIGERLLMTDGHYEDYDLNNNKVTTITEVAKANKVELSKIDDDDLSGNGTGVKGEVRVYFNGVQIPIAKSNSGRELGDYYYNTDDNLVKYIGGTKGASNFYENAVDLANGVKVEYIDNDEGGEVEVISITEYTVADVSGIADDKNTGADAIERNTINFRAYNTAKVSAAGDLSGYTIASRTDTAYATQTKKIADVVVTDGKTLAVKDLVTYVEYDGEFYVTVSVPSREKLNRINYSGNTLANIESVKFNDTYWKASVNSTGYPQDYYLGNDDLLIQANLGKSYNVYRDPYGYLLKVQEPTATTYYLYVDETNHSDTLRGKTEARVVFPGGGVDIVTLSYGNVNVFGDIPSHIYSYVYDEEADLYEIDNGYYLNVECFDTASMSLSTSTLNLYDEDGANRGNVTRSTVFVDVRNITPLTTEAKIYTGYQELPSITGAVVHYVLDEDGYVTLAYISSGSNAAASTDVSFIAYQTKAAYTTTDEYGLKWYYMAAITGGKDDYVKLTETQYNYVKTYGVGIYQWTKGVPSFTAFNEVWKEVIWKDGHLVTSDGTSYAYNDSSVKFFTLSITNGKAYDYIPVSGTDGVEDDETVHAHMVSSGKNVSEIYVVRGELASTAASKRTVTKYDGLDNVVGTYTVADNYITEYVARNLRSVWVFDKNKVLIGEGTYPYGSTVIEVKLNGNISNVAQIPVDDFTCYWYDRSTTNPRVKDYNSIAPEAWHLWSASPNFSAEYDIATKTLTITREAAGTFGENLAFVLTEESTPAPGGGGPNEENKATDWVANASKKLYDAHGIEITGPGKFSAGGGDITITVKANQFKKEAAKSTHEEGEETYKLIEGKMTEANYTPSNNDNAVVEVGFETGKGAGPGNFAQFDNFVVENAQGTPLWPAGPRGTETVDLGQNIFEQAIYQSFTIATYKNGEWVMSSNGHWIIEYDYAGNHYTWHIYRVIDTTTPAE